MMKRPRKLEEVLLSNVRKYVALERQDNGTTERGVARWLLICQLVMDIEKAYGKKPRWKVNGDWA